MTDLYRQLIIKAIYKVSSNVTAYDDFFHLMTQKCRDGHYMFSCHASSLHSGLNLIRSCLGLRWIFFVHHYTKN